MKTMLSIPVRGENFIWGEFKTCDKHFSGCLVIWDTEGDCPICGLIDMYEKEIKDLKGEISNLEWQMGMQDVWKSESD